MEVLRLENLSKFYTSESSVVMGLNSINLSFSTGEFVALTGESGSGKSTLAHVLGGILPYEAGELYIYGQPTSHYDPHDRARYRRDLISFISQSYGILPGNTVSENVESALRLSGLSREEACRRASAILEEVELSDLKKRKAGKLSSGQKQRLSIARALAKPSRILIADEPTGNLDRENSEKIIALLKRASEDRLVILITHEFEEAKDVATRRIVLADGVVVTDAALADAMPDGEAVREQVREPLRAGKDSVKGGAGPLSPYVCRLTLQARPVFSAILVLLLAVTMFISFVFVGNFIIALDDTSTRIYDREAFFNGSTDRLAVMRSDGGALTEEDYARILSLRHVESLQPFGQVSDLIYHYREDVDHKLHRQVVQGEAYDPIMNPDDYTVETVVELSRTVYSYAAAVPKTEDAFLTEGRLPTGVYEAVSADPAYQVGDRVRVYIRDVGNWSAGSYLQLDLTVVGTTSMGSGLYFSERLAAALVNPMFPLDVRSTHRPWGMRFVFLPYDETIFSIAEGYPEVTRLEEDQYLCPTGANREVLPPFMVYTSEGEELVLEYASFHAATLNSVMLVSPAAFERLTPYTSEQASVYIKDYSYTERVLTSLKEEGYVALSPYQLGATEVDEQLARERLITLAVCAATFLIAFVLQCILLRTLLASLFEYYRVMSSTGLTCGIASRAVTLLLLLTTLVGEGLGVGVICLLNLAEVERVVNIFKYLDGPLIVLLFLLHFVTVALSLGGILTALGRSVFGKSRIDYDIDFTLMEEAS